MPPIIVASQLAKRFNNLTVVDGINFHVEQGECFGFLGPNGAGKTTTMKMVYCGSPKTAGKLEVAGLDVDRHPREIKAFIGVAPQENNLDPDFTVHQNLVVYSRYFDIPREEAEKRINQLLEFFHLQDVRNYPIDKLSTGMKKRLILARALLNDPKILILDEPTTGLDPQARHLIWERLQRLRLQGVTVLLTTHYMEEAAQLCDRLVIMDHGKIIAEGSPQHLVEEYAGREVLEITGEAAIVDYLTRNYSNLDFETVEKAVHIFVDEPELLLIDLRKNFKIERAAIRAASLEDVFLKLTGRELRD
jgi:lipooligosaccharide transport system ATP-binding protein